MIRICLAAVAMLFLLTSCAERNEVVSDVTRYGEGVGSDYEQTVSYVKWWVNDNIRDAGRPAADVERFLEWRKREWWNLEEDLAYHIHHDWQQISKLMDDVASYFGYEIAHWPRNRDAVLSYFKNASVEWRNLTMDVVVFYEYHSGGWRKMSKFLREHYHMHYKEAANLQIDVKNFLEWREREYTKLVRNGRIFFNEEMDLVDSFKNDLYRYKEMSKTEMQWFVADMRGFLYERTRFEVPRLRDDLYRFFYLQDVEDFERIKSSFALAKIEGQKLADDLRRYGNYQIEQGRVTLEWLEQFFKTYEYEYGPLKEDIKRFWRYHISQGEVLMDEFRYHFGEQLEEEYYEMLLGMKRFVSYGGVEWAAFKDGIKRFFNYNPAFGDGALPTGGRKQSFIRYNHSIHADPAFGASP